MPDETPFTVPRSALCVFPQVLEEYELHTLPDLAAPVVIDLGANVGAFSWFALMRWADAKVLAFEPHPVTAETLRKNLKGLPVEVQERAVVYPRTRETARLFEGKNANTECSLRDDVRWPHVSQDLEHSNEVQLFDAAELPPCAVLKVDTEGSEVEILTGYQHLDEVDVLLVEAHAVGGDLKGQMRQIAQLAAQAGLDAVDVRGTTIRFVRHLSAMKSLPRGPVAAILSTKLPEGDWYEVETLGGTWRFCRLSGEIGSAGCTLDPCYRIHPTRTVVPHPHPGQGLLMIPVDLAEPYVWGDGGAETVWPATMKKLSPERAAVLHDVMMRQRG